MGLKTIKNKLLLCFVCVLTGFATMADSVHEMYHRMAMDFSGRSESSRLTTEMKKRMLERRLGWYESFLNDDFSGLDFVEGVKPCGIAVRISGSDEVSLMIKDSNGGYRSCPELMHGRFSDVWMMWGTADKILFAEYGMLSGKMALVLSPRGLQKVIRLEKIDRNMDGTPIDFDGITFKGVPDRTDWLDNICPELAKREKVMNSAKGPSAETGVVGYYESKMDKSVAGFPKEYQGVKWIKMYYRLADNGRAKMVFGDGKGKFIEFRCHNLDENWYVAFACPGICRDGSWKVERQQLCELTSPFIRASLEEDSSIRSPKSLIVRDPVSGVSKKDLLDMEKKRLVDPDRWVVLTEWIRMEENAGNRTIFKAIDECGFSEVYDIGAIGRCPF